MVGLFFEFLRDNPLPAGYTNPSHAWIDEVLLGLGLSNRAFRGSGFTDRNLWNELSIGLGGDRELGRLVLAAKDMNLKKATFFGGKSPTVGGEVAVTDTRRAHRDVSNIFPWPLPPMI